MSQVCRLNHRIADANGGYNYPLNWIRDFSPEAKNSEMVNGLKVFLSWGSAPNPGVFGRHIAVFDGQNFRKTIWLSPNLAKQVGSVSFRKITFLGSDPSAPLGVLGTNLHPFPGTF